MAGDAQQVNPIAWIEFKRFAKNGILFLPCLLLIARPAVAGLAHLSLAAARLLARIRSLIHHTNGIQCHS